MLAADEIDGKSTSEPVGHTRWTVIACTFAIAAVSYLGRRGVHFFTWFFKYLSDVHGLNLKSSAFYATLPFVAMAPASWLGGLASDRLVAVAGGAGALYFAQSAFWAMSADIGGPSAGLLSGIMNMGCQIGGVVTAALTPVLANAFGWTASFAITAGVALLGAASWAFVDPFHHVTLRPK